MGLPAALLLCVAVRPHNLRVLQARAKEICSSPHVYNDSSVALPRALGALCHGGGGNGTVTGACFTLDAQSWHLFSPVLCAKGPAAPRFALPLLRSVSGRRVLMMGDSMMVQTAVAMRCEFERAGVRTEAEWGRTPTPNFDFTVPEFNVTVMSRWMSQFIDVNVSHVSAALHYNRADIAVINMGLWYGHRRCGIHGDLQQGSCPYGWRRQAWMRDVADVVKLLRLWRAQAPGRLAMLRETPATHWRAGRFSTGPGSSVEACSALQEAALPAPINVVALGGGAGFCDYPHGKRELMNVSMEADQNRMLRMLGVAGSIPVITWFDLQADLRALHPGAFWLYPFNPMFKKLACDCAHWCYDEEVWGVWLAALSAAVREQLT